MLATIPHRGPDDHGVHAGPGLALGFVRLSILDPTDRGHQPFVLDESDAALVYNGEVYNYVELRRELEAEGLRFASTGDTEVVFRALERWGPEEAIRRFDGMFAFAFVDPAGGLWLGRDRLGIKGCYIRQVGGHVVFGSEAKAVLAGPGPAATPSSESMRMLFLRSRLEEPRTMWHEIEALPAGSLRRYDATGVVEDRWFSVPESVDIDRLVANQAIPLEDMVDHFADALDRAVRQHLRSDVPLAVMTSGGVDSSLISAFARRRQPDIVGYVADLPLAESEAPQARRVARHLGIEMRVVSVSVEDNLRNWPRAAWLSDTPPWMRSNVALLRVAEVCKADGISVVVTGEGSDELFGGYPWQAQTHKAWRRYRSRYDRLIARLQPGFRRAMRHRPLHTDFARLDPMARIKVLPALDPTLGLRPRRLLQALEAVEPDADRAFKAQCFDDLYRHLGPILHRMDRMSMGASVEMRVPFISNELIDLGLHAPRSWLLDRGRGKLLVKRAAEAHLPHDVVHARKRGFPSPDSFSTLAPDILGDGALADLLGWSSRDLADMVSFVCEQPGTAFGLASMELWSQVFVGGADPAELGESLVARHQRV